MFNAGVAAFVIGIILLIFLLTLLLSAITAEQSDSDREAGEGDSSKQQTNNAKPEVLVAAIADAIHTYRHYRRSDDANRAKRERYTIGVLGITAILALFAAGASIYSAVIFSSQLDAFRDQERRQLRAYVGLQGTGINDFIISKKFSITFTAKNTGSTPAFDVTMRGYAGIQRYPLPDDTYIIVSKRPDISRATIFPGAEYDGYTTSEATLGAQDVADVLDGHGKRLYIIEFVNYRDAFGRKHWTSMCASLGGAYLRGAVAQAIRAGAPVKGEMSEYCNKYNDTDDSR